MEKYKINENLYLFSSYIQPIDLSFNQYLICKPEPILIHTGSIDQTEVLVPILKEVLGSRPLKYVFISHFESDECGGLSLLTKHFPEVKAICSAITARQLNGFGMAANVLMVKPDDILDLGESSFQFILYPSEMHLWEGLMIFEKQKGLLFSSDVFIRMGKLETPIAESVLNEEIRNIKLQQIPSPGALKQFQDTISALPVKYLMPGHGPCLKVY
jgi:flavorubredoxin